MADDIDIEEHDVLDNPRIKNIFPDITSIKTEVIDYEEEGIVESEIENYETYQYNPVLEEVDEEIPSLYQNRIILGTKPCESSEPTSESEDEIPEIIESSVVLEDWGVLLQNNPCYCCSCQILFPTENALDSHKMIAHSFLVAVGRNKAIKSTGKSSISARLRFEADNEVLCNHCNKIFPDEIALLKHSYELIPRKFACDFCDLVFDNEVVCKIHEMTHSNASGDMVVMRCPICTCHFKYTNKLTSHMSHQHNIVLTDFPERIRPTYKCAYCPAILRDNKRYNGHICSRHSEFYTKVVEDKTESDKFKCLPCNLTFPSAYSEKIHRAAQHANAKNTDLLTKHSLSLEKPIKVEPLSNLPQKTDIGRRPIPKSTLFKCNKCQIHFVSSLVAVEHTKRCVLTKGEWKCKKCRRSFKYVDRHVHNIQHEWTERFKVIIIGDNITNNILCRCKSCKICFDERSLLKYHVNGCVESNTVLCNICNYRVHEHAITKHKRIHNELGSEQFLLVDFMSFDVSSENSKPALGNSDSKAKLRRKEKKEKFYYYCPTCKCYMKINKFPDKHHNGRCTKQIKCICKLCGLTFSTKSYMTHKKEHKKFTRLKLADLTFKSTQSGRKINPPFPEFKECNNCFVKFFSSVALKSHVCDIEEAKACDYCGDKFSDLAFKLHVPFHEYSGTEKKKKFTENIPELIKKYESMQIIWNILFLCETCDTILDSYDDVVEHGQDHFCNMESYNVTINHCSKCDLKIVGKCYEKHKEIHAANTISKSSFKILPYKYDTLLSDSWYDMFKTLAKEQVDQILNSSKYKHTRSVRMKLLLDGPIDMTLYQCAVCETMIDWGDVAEHARDSNNCSKIGKFTCSMCQLHFATKRSHEDLHENRDSMKKSLRIITFNNKQDLYVNDSLRSKMNPEGLKFIRCQHCGKLINKAKYKKHVLHHKYYGKIKKDAKNRKNQPKFLVRPNFKKAEALVHNFYKCVKCGVCVFKNNVFKHFCSFKKQKKQCPKCHLWFRSSNMMNHTAYHKKYKLTKNNVKIYTFKDGKVEIDCKNGAQVTLYQCLDCSVCLHKETNIKRHICISTNFQNLCPLCEMPFHCSRMRLHKRLHDSKEFSKKDIIVKKFKSKVVLAGNQTKKSVPKSKQVTKIKEKTEIIYKTSKKWKLNKLDELKNREFLRHVHIRFFKCTCNLFFLTCADFLEHVTICPRDNKGVKCETCELVFHRSSIDLHKKNNKCPAKQSTVYIVTLDAANGLEYDNTTCLFRCWKCDINYITFRGVFIHIEKDHVVKQKQPKCDSCNIFLSTRTFPYHKSIHHRYKNSSLSNLNRFTVFKTTLYKTLKHLPIDSETNDADNAEANKSIDLDKKGVKRKLPTEDIVQKHRKIDDGSENTIEEPNYELFRCQICDLNFLHKKTFKVHQYGKHKEKQFTCPKCGLKFTQNSLTRHLKTHHNQPNSTHDKDICEMNKVQRNPKTSYEAENVDSSESVELTSNHENSLKIEKIEVTPTQNENIVQNTNTPTQHANKLYKCSHCDVYFLFSDACRDHVSNHITLDPTEYIACKICDLQFLCEYLGSHMKCHREKTFSIDEVIVEEYHFSDGEIKTDSYSAADRIKSKLVTTTTYFDTEESTIDSTVSGTEIKRNFNDSVVSNENSVNNEGVSENSDIEMKSANPDAESVTCS